MQQRDNRMRARRPTYGRGNAPPRYGGNRSASGNARQKCETYLARAREAQVASDAVEMENCYQHAENYWRVMRAAETDPPSAPGRMSHEQP